VNWEEAYEELAHGGKIASASRGIAYGTWTGPDDEDGYPTDSGFVMYGIWTDEQGRVRADVYDDYGECEPGTPEDQAATDWVAC